MYVVYDELLGKEPKSDENRKVKKNEGKHVKLGILSQGGSDNEPQIQDESDNMSL